MIQRRSSSMPLLFKKIIEVKKEKNEKHFLINFLG
jgi:hypothetical protein